MRPRAAPGRAAPPRAWTQRAAARALRPRSPAVPALPARSRGSSMALSATGSTAAQQPPRRGRPARPGPRPEAWRPTPPTCWTRGAQLAPPRRAPHARRAAAPDASTLRLRLRRRPNSCRGAHRSCSRDGRHHRRLRRRGSSRLPGRSRSHSCTPLDRRNRARGRRSPGRSSRRRVGTVRPSLPALRRQSRRRCHGGRRLCGRSPACRGRWRWPAWG
mmetsp:Transcript_53472/g.168338  ORF Transcript_53472/g.168338 Transcript_53472/m.168338 type:complete len:217 (+) Transcript_53472:1271-1921(+)